MNPKQLKLISDRNTMPSSVKTPLIISASRRTDLPGFFPEECAETIRKKVQRLRTRFLYGVMFWTKQPLPFLTCEELHSLVSQLANPMLQLTITGLGGTSLEPGIPPCDQVLRVMPSLISLFKNNPERIRWRFDPILHQKNDLHQFKAIADRMVEFGIHECTISFPTYFSLKGNLKRQFDLAGIPEWESDQQRKFLDQLVKAATDRGISLKSCAQPQLCETHPKISPASCVDGALFQRLHPDAIPLALPKDPSQRKHCNCVLSEDIGSYATHRCRGGCVYCYSKAGGSFSDSERTLD